MGIKWPQSARAAALRDSNETVAPGKPESPQGAVFRQGRLSPRTDLVAGMAGMAAFVGRGPQQQDSLWQWPQLQYWA